MDNYIVINGKKAELTEEQLKALGIETRKNPFERVKERSVYYRVTEYGRVDDYTESGDYTDCHLYEGVNYFNDESFAKQVALHQLLYRKLLKFAYDYGCEDMAEWDGNNDHYSIFYDTRCNHCDFQINWEHKSTCTVYFNSEEAVIRAITEVVKPFIQEHPEFVW